VAVASAENLRTQSHEVPLDNARGARVLGRMQQRAANKPTNAASHGRLSAEELKMDRDELKKVLLAKAGRRLQEGEFDSPWAQVAKGGSLVTRSRPNSDCSGPVIEIGVDPAGTCHMKDSTSSLWEGVYVSSEGEMFWTVSEFENADCTGEPMEVHQNGSPKKACQMLAGQMGSSGALMGGSVLTDKTPAQMARQEKPGFMVSNYEESDCSGDMTGYTLYREDACHLDIEYNNREDDEDQIISMDDLRNFRRLDHRTNEYLTTDSTFSYVKVNKCQGNTVYITGYTDSACTHKSYKAEVDLVEEDAYESFITCRRNVAEHHYYDDEDTDDYMGRQVSGSFSEGTCSG